MDIKQIIEQDEDLIRFWDKSKITEEELQKALSIFRDVLTFDIITEDDKFRLVYSFWGNLFTRQTQAEAYIYGLWVGIHLI